MPVTSCGMDAEIVEVEKVGEWQVMCRIWPEPDRPTEWALVAGDRQALLFRSYNAAMNYALAHTPSGDHRWLEPPERPDPSAPPKLK